MRLVFILVCSVFYQFTSAQTVTFKDWRITSNSDPVTFSAETANESGSMFGQVCLVEKSVCYYILASSATCQDGHKAALLVNASTGSFNAVSHCTHFGNSAAQVLEPFDDFDSAVKQSKMIGLALPMQDGTFNVTRFSLSGAKDAVVKMRNIVEKAVSAVKTNTKDQSL